MIQYLLDENLPAFLGEQLVRRVPGLVVRRVGRPEAPGLSTPDPDILCWCERQRFVLFTQNRRSMPDHLHDHLAAGKHIPGIILPPRQMSVGQVIEQLSLAAELAPDDEFTDRIVTLLIF